MPAIRSTKAEIKRLTTNPSTKQIIDGLWRAPLWMHDEILISDDDLFKLIAGEDFDERYIFEPNTFLDEDENPVSFAAVEGFGNKLQADFAHIFGFFNTASSFAETIIGTYGLGGVLQTPDSWIETDRLFTIANGATKLNRSDAFNMYKSGYAVYRNAVAISKYVHGSVAPLDGTFQFDLFFKGYYAGAWHIFATVDQLPDLSGYALKSEIPDIPPTHPAATLDPTSESELTLNPTTQVFKLSGLKKTFLSLNDTPSAYPVTGRGNGLIAGSANVFFADTYGSDSEGFWAKVVAEIESFGSDVIPNSHFNPSTGWTIGSNWSLQTIGSDIWAVYESTGSTGSITQSVTLEAGKTYEVQLTASSSVSRLIEVTIGGQTVATFPTTYNNSSDDNKVRFTQETSGTFILGIKATFSGYLNVLAVYVFEINVTAGRGLRMCNSGHATQYILPTSAPAANDIVYARSDGQLVFGQLSKVIENSDILTDSDFPTEGLMKTDGEGNYIAVPDNSETWDKAITDDDFPSPGLMKSDGAGNYTVVADNSAAWNSAPVFVKLTAAAYTALTTEQKNNGTWYATY